MHPKVPWENLNYVYNSSEIVVGIHREPERLTELSLNLRVFEALGSGSFLLSDDAAGIERFFTPGRDLVVVHDSKEATDAATYYLDNEEDRERIAKSGYEKCRKHHTIAHRAERILHVLRSLGA